MTYPLTMNFIWVDKIAFRETPKPLPSHLAPRPHCLRAKSSSSPLISFWRVSAGVTKPVVQAVVMRRMIFYMQHDGFTGRSSSFEHSWIPVVCRGSPGQQALSCRGFSGQAGASKESGGTCGRDRVLRSMRGEDWRAEFGYGGMVCPGHTRHPDPHAAACSSASGLRPPGRPWRRSCIKDSAQAG